MTDSTTQLGAWSAVAEAWDTHVDYVDEHSVEATDAMLAAVAIQPGERVLELACGPGTLGHALAERVGADGAVLLSDLAPPMVDVAARRTADLANVSTAVIDASAIDHPDGSFDAVVSRMGLQFTPDPAVAFSEIRRVLAPGGRMGALTWGALEHNPWVTCVGIAGMLNGIVSGGPPVGPGTIFGLGDPGALEALAKGAGFLDVQVQELSTVFHVPSIEEHIQRVSSLAGGPLAEGYGRATPEQLDAAVQSAAELAAPHRTDDGYVIPGRILLVAGRA